MSLTLISILIISVIIIIIYKYKKSLTIEGLYTFNGRMAINDQWFVDKLFDDVYYMPNKYEQPYKTGEEIGKLAQTGYDYCSQFCPGTCLEYGITGNAYCFVNRLYSI